MVNILTSDSQMNFDIMLNVDNSLRIFGIKGLVCRIYWPTGEIS